MYRQKHVFPSYTQLEHLADACVHAAGVVFSFAATAFLLVTALRTLPAADIAGLIVYCAGMICMFAASAAYNLVQHQGLKEIFRRLDHSAIFIMIAGSYTPFAIVVGGGAGGFMLAAVWAIAVIRGTGCRPTAGWWWRCSRGCGRQRRTRSRARTKTRSALVPAPALVLALAPHVAASQVG